MIFKIGPLTLYRVKHNGTLDIYFTCLGDWPFGWEYGWKDGMRGEDRPWVELRVGKLNIFYFEPYKRGVELWILGFWLIV